jgi:hypothetical protein
MAWKKVMNIFQESVAYIFRAEEWRQQVPAEQKLSARLHIFCGITVNEISFLFIFLL